MPSLAFLLQIENFLALLLKAKSTFAAPRLERRDGLVRVPWLKKESISISLYVQEKELLFETSDRY